MFPRLIFLLLLTTLFAGCAATPKNKTENWTAEQFYAEARDALRNGQFQQAIEYYETLEARFPFGRLAQQAAMEVAYAYYRYDEPDSAITAADRFIKTYPRHPHVDYLYYLKGLTNFNRGVGLLDKWLGDDQSERDPRTARESFRDFSELVERFPNSRYVSDARQRMLYLRNTLAQYEIHVANYYLERKAWVAAANRAKYVIENYPRTPALPEALRVMQIAYQALELTDLAEDARRVLELNTPPPTEVGPAQAN